MEDEAVPEPRTYARRLVKGSAIVFVALVASGFIAFLLRMFLARKFQTFKEAKYNELLVSSWWIELKLIPK